MDGLIYAVSLVAGLVLLFVDPVRHLLDGAQPRVPWRAIWPGALAATLAIGVVDYAFPLYLSTISTLARSDHDLRVRADRADLVLRARDHHARRRACINAMRFEIHDTGELSLPDAAGRLTLQGGDPRSAVLGSVGTVAMSSPNRRLRCLIVDEHPVVRQGVRALLEETWPGAAWREADRPRRRARRER